MGDRTAFTRLADAVGPGLYRYALRMLGDEYEAQDCVQETLLSAWTGLDSFREESRVRTWLFGIEANLVRRRLRRQPPAPVDPESAAQIPGPDDPATEALAADLRAALDLALTGLPPAQREAWLLVTVEALTYREVAEVQATTVSTVRGRVERARRQLERRLAPWR
nr:sigma-70 family RNA polymerase sigma factor [Cellulomonas sp. RIT-PI-Y]